MKRRLDLALALVHRPRLLFLDEPTTGLDPQSRTALWDEVARLAREDGVTVFLTTQYLEEADVLATGSGSSTTGTSSPRARRGAEGARSAARPSRPSRPRASTAAAWTRRSPASASPLGHGDSDVAVRLREGVTGLADVVRALDDEGLAVENLELHAPSLDDVFLAKTGRSLEGAGDESENGAGPQE